MATQIILTKKGMSLNIAAKSLKERVLNTSLPKEKQKQKRNNSQHLHHSEMYESIKVTDCMQHGY